VGFGKEKWGKGRVINSDDRWCFSSYQGCPLCDDMGGGGRDGARRWCGRRVGDGVGDEVMDRRRERGHEVMAYGTMNHEP
jgi:hypothetical protein